MSIEFPNLVGLLRQELTDLGLMQVKLQGHKKVIAVRIFVSLALLIQYEHQRELT